MKFGASDIPTALLEAAFSNTLIIFAGAGVSAQKPLEFPLFDALVEKIKSSVNPANRLRKRKASRNETGSLIYRESPEQYLGYLESKGCDIRAACSAQLASAGRTSELHANLIRLFSSENSVKVVTTNF